MFYIKNTEGNEINIWTKGYCYNSTYGMWNVKKQKYENMTEEEFLTLARNNNWFWKHSPKKTFDLINSQYPQAVIVSVE